MSSSLITFRKPQKQPKLEIPIMKLLGEIESIIKVFFWMIALERFFSNISTTIGQKPIISEKKKGIINNRIVTDDGSIINHLSFVSTCKIDVMIYTRALPLPHVVLGYIVLIKSHYSRRIEDVCMYVAFTSSLSDAVVVSPF